MKMYKLLIPLVLVAMLAAIQFCMIPAKKTLAAAGNGRIDFFRDGIRVGSDAGTALNLISAKQLVFSGTATSTCSLPGARPGDTYLFFDGWSSSSAEYGKTVYATTTNTIVVTTSSPTTGTLNLLILGLR